MRNEKWFYLAQRKIAEYLELNFKNAICSDQTIKNERVYEEYLAMDMREMMPRTIIAVIKKMNNGSSYLSIYSDDSDKPVFSKQFAKPRVETYADKQVSLASSN